MLDWSTLVIPGQSSPMHISARVARMITSGELRPGERIPAERDLSEALRVSRATVREALRELELRGLVDRRRGRGTVVSDTPRPLVSADLFGDLDASHRVLREVMDLRAVIEPPIAERAASRATLDQVDRLRDLVELATSAVREGVAPERYVELDVAFHLALAEMTGNPLLERLLGLANEWMAPSRRSVLQTERRIRASIHAHRAILDAVERHDADAAHREMEAHVADILALIVGDESPLGASS